MTKLRRVWNWVWPVTVGGLTALGLLASVLWVSGGGVAIAVGSVDAPAWIQAVGSVLAILVSAGFAIWTPLYVHDQQERNAVRRATNVLVMFIGRAQTAWMSAQQVLDAKQWNSGTAGLLKAQIGRILALEPQVPVSMQLGVAFVIVADVSTQLDVLIGLVDRIDRQPNPYALASAVPFREAIQELDVHSKKGAKFDAKKVSGSWMIWHPEDEADIEAAKGSQT